MAEQVICAYAYDNSRRRVGRWVGRTDPNGDDLQVWQRDHSNGDQASAQVAPLPLPFFRLSFPHAIPFDHLTPPHLTSPHLDYQTLEHGGACSRGRTAQHSLLQHCWRIVMQSPPSFITDVDGGESPFSKEWIESTTVYTPTSGEGYRVEAAFKRVPMAVAQYRRIRFVAQDPQARDRVQIVVLEEPGIVNNLKVGRSQCLERAPAASDAGMCRAQDLIDQARYPDEPWKAPMDTEVPQKSPSNEPTRSK